MCLCVSGIYACCVFVCLCFYIFTVGGVERGLCRCAGICRWCVCVYVYACVWACVCVFLQIFQSHYFITTLHASWCIGQQQSSSTPVCHWPASGWCPSWGSCPSFPLPQFFRSLSSVDHFPKYTLFVTGVTWGVWSLEARHCHLRISCPGIRPQVRFYLQIKRSLCCNPVPFQSTHWEFRWRNVGRGEEVERIHICTKLGWECANLHDATKKEIMYTIFLCLFSNPFQWFFRYAWVTWTFSYDLT